MMTPADIARQKRIERDRRLRDVIYEHSYPVNDCVIWLDSFSSDNRSCWVVDFQTGQSIDIKRFVTGTKVPAGMRPVWAVACGHNRCIRVAHQRVVKFVPLHKGEGESAPLLAANFPAAA